MFVDGQNMVETCTIHY